MGELLVIIVGLIVALAITCAFRLGSLSLVFGFQRIHLLIP